jgi:O-antigen ligase
MTLMPLHAFLTVWAGHLVGHQAIWQGWKEVVVVLVAVAAGWQFATQPKLRARLHQPLMYLIAVFILLALIITVFARPELAAAALGLKVDVEFLVLFVAAFTLSTPGLRQRLTQILLAASGAVIGFGVLQATVLPKDFLSHFGYGPDTILPYLSVDPIIPAVRIISTLGGPNQLGSFLILPLCLVTALMLRRLRWWQPIYLLAGMAVMWHTHSRAAWLGLAVGLVITIMMNLPRRWRIWMVLLTVVTGALGLQLLIQNAGNSQLQYYLFHGSLRNNGIATSTDLHRSALESGLDRSLQHPLGEGLGTAGPASFQSAHPFIPESYYLQLAVETGIAGLLIFAALELMLARQLVRQNQPDRQALLGALAGMAVVNLFLHGWADSSTALTFWALAGASLGAEEWLE